VLTNSEIRELIPQTGSMSLLNSVEKWDTKSIVCTAISHLDPENPLRSRGRLNIVSGVEYAAQAMAVHYALCSSMPCKLGYLGAVTEMDYSIARLDTVSDLIEISAQLIFSHGQGLIYRFKITSGGDTIMTGRVSVYLEKGEQI
jgi:predicted hotdog family 3-hydroxylacyl-ACP dehydratase